MFALIEKSLGNAGLVDKGSEFVIAEPISNSNWLRYIHFGANTFGKSTTLHINPLAMRQLLDELVNHSYLR